MGPASLPTATPGQGHRGLGDKDMELILGFAFVLCVLCFSVAVRFRDAL
jgi:hypothetical protein